MQKHAHVILSSSFFTNRFTRLVVYITIHYPHAPWGYRWRKIERWRVTFSSRLFASMRSRVFPFGNGNAREVFGGPKNDAKGTKLLVCMARRFLIPNSHVCLGRQRWGCWQRHLLRATVIDVRNTAARFRHIRSEAGCMPDPFGVQFGRTSTTSARLRCSQVPPNARNGFIFDQCLWS